VAVGGAASVGDRDRGLLVIVAQVGFALALSASLSRSRRRV
jgi:hypothetical protein